jgi:8-oxo-dGTP pyrophosphatase MutT (NUDIX family)
MTPEQFSSRFCLTTPVATIKDEPARASNTTSRNAAVLVPVIKRPHGLTLLFTQRAKHLRHHPGQISFPGGKQDLEDSSLAFTALRETYEEVGIAHNHITPLGWLPNFITSSNFNLHPLVGLIEDISLLALNPAEVESVFEVPLNNFLQRQEHHKIKVHANNIHHNVHFMPYQDKLIWGVTASIIDQLVSHFE